MSNIFTFIMSEYTFPKESIEELQNNVKKCTNKQKEQEACRLKTQQAFQFSMFKTGTQNALNNMLSNSEKGSNSSWLRHNNNNSRFCNSNNTECCNNLKQFV